MATNDIIARLRVVGQAAFQGAMEGAAASTAKVGTSAQKADASTQQLGKGMGKTVSPLRKAAVGLAKVAGGAAALYAAKRGITASVNATMELGKSTMALQRATGLDAKTASGWAEITKVRGINTKQFQVGLVKLSKTMEAAKGGNDKAAASLAHLGVNQDMIQKGDVAGALTRSADAFALMKSPAEKAATAQALFGKSGQALLPLLASGSAGIQEQMDLVNKYGATIANTKDAKAMVAQQREMKYAMDGLKVSVGTALLPVLVSLAQAFGQLVAVLQPFLRNSTLVKVAVVAITLAFLAYKIAVIASTVASLGMVAVWALIPLAIIAIGAALIYAYKKVEWFRNAVNAVGAWIKAHWKAIIFSLLLPLPALIIAVAKHFDKIKALARKLPGALLAVGKLMVRALVAGIKAAPGAVLDAIKSLLPGGKVGRAMGKLVGGVVGQFAVGGVTPRSGTALVGERGPELLQLPGGSRITPLPSPALSTPALAGAAASHTTAHFYLDRRLIATAVATDTADRQARR